MDAAIQIRIRHAYYSRVYKILQTRLKTISRKVKALPIVSLWENGPCKVPHQKPSNLRQRVDHARAILLLL